MQKTDAEIAHDVYMRLKGETPRERARREAAEAIGESIDKAMFELFKNPTIFRPFKAPTHDDFVDAVAYASSQLVGKRARGIILDDISAA